MRFLIFISLSMLLIACNGSDNTAIDPTPFSVEVTHLPSAVENQLVTIKLQVNGNHTIASSELTLGETAPVEIVKISESEYQLTITEFYLTQELPFQITANNGNNKSTTKESSISLKLNYSPIVSFDKWLYEVNESNSFIVILNALDVEEHDLSYQLTSTNENVSIAAITNNSFNVTVPASLTGQGVQIIATVTDQYQKIGHKYKYISIKNNETTFEISGPTGVLTQSSEYYRLETKNLPDNVTVSSISWLQTIGPNIKITPRSELDAEINFTKTKEQEAIQIAAEITLSNNEVITVSKDIVTIKNLTANFNLIDSNIVNDAIAKREAEYAKLDINHDGLTDIVTLESYFVYAQLQTSDGLYQDKIKIAELTFHQWLSDPSFPGEIHNIEDNLTLTREDIAQRLTVQNMSSRDMNNDGILDLAILGHLCWQKYTYCDSVAGWVLGTTKTISSADEDYFKVDYFYSHDTTFTFGEFFADMNLDGLIDWVWFSRFVDYSYISYVSVYYNNVSIFFSNPIIHFDTGYKIDISTFGDLHADNEKDLITLISSKPRGEIGGKSWLKIHTLNNTTKEFNQDISIVLPDNVSGVHLIDVTDDGIDDIIFYDSAMGSYYYLTDIH